MPAVSIGGLLDRLLAEDAPNTDLTTGIIGFGITMGELILTRDRS